MSSIPPFLRKILGAGNAGVVGDSRALFAYQLHAMKSMARIEVVSSSFRDGEFIPRKYSARGGNVSPSLSWEVGPGPTQSYAIVMEGAGSSAGMSPAVHWLAWNIPPDCLSLPEDLLTRPDLPKKRRMQQGLNATGGSGYSGPDGEQLQRYFIQVFAMDGPLALSGGAAREALLAASDGRVLAVGVLSGKFGDHPAGSETP